MAIWSIIGKAAGGGVRAGGAYVQGTQDIRETKLAAELALEKGRAEALALRNNMDVLAREGRSEISTLANEYSNRGYMSTEGSPLLSATKEYADLIADSTEMNRQANNAEIRAKNEHDAYRRKVKSLRRGMKLQAVGSLLGS